MLATKLRMAAGNLLGAVDWWDVSGKTCIGAWAAKGAASLAASYTDLSGTGNNLSLGVAPTWNTTTGWTFNGTTQYLQTGITCGQGYSFIVRFSSASTAGSNFLAGADSSTNRRLYLWSTLGTSHVFGAGGYLIVAGGAYSSGVMAVAGNQGYYNGSTDGGAIPAYSGDVEWQPLIGAATNVANNNPNFSQALTKDIQAVALYSDTLTSGEISDLTDAMNAL